MNILCAYNANIDSIYHIKGTEVSRIIEEFQVDDLSFSENLQKKLSSSPGSISSKTDLIAGLITCMRSGTGAEWTIKDVEVFEWIKQTFRKGSFMRMGGNMGIMSNVLSELGAFRVVPNVASLSKLQLSFFSTGSIYIPFNGELYKIPELKNVTLNENDRSELIHFVFDFIKGDEVTFSGQKFTVPRENRFIATYDPLNSQLYMNEQFEKYSQEHVAEMDGAIISGYHMLPDDDTSDFKERIDQSLKQLQGWKELRKDLHIHVEFGHFFSDDVALYTFSTFSPVVDSMGMNEDELAMLAGLNGIDPGPILSMDSVAIAEAAISLCNHFGLCKMLVHTREFVLSVSFKRDDNSEVIIEAMSFGVSCAAAFACHGKLADRKIMLELASEIPESKIGKKESSRLAEHMDEKLECNAVCGVHHSYHISIVPTRLCDDPVSTVGLGDTISSAIFLRQLELNS